MQIRSIKKAASQALRTGSERPRYLSFLFAVCCVAPALVYQIADLLVGASMDTSPVGLSGFGRFSLHTAYLSLSTLLWVALTLCITLWELFYQNFALNLSRGKQVSFRDFTAPIRIAGKVIWLQFLIVLYVYLWILLFMFPTSMVVTFLYPDIINLMVSDQNAAFLFGMILALPGLLMMYRYRLAFLILFDHEDWTASQAIRESKLLTRGYKMRFFKLDVSYLWYYLLMLLPSLLVPYLFTRLAADTLAASLLSITLSLLIQMVLLALFFPQVKLADAVLYQYILDHPPIAPPVPDTGFPVFHGPQDPPCGWISGPDSQQEQQDSSHEP